MKTILLTFADDDERDVFLEAIKGAADSMVNSSDMPEGFADREASGLIIQKTLNTVKLDPPIKEDHERQCALFISGEKIVEGNLTDLNLRFSQEIAVHSGSVIIKELCGGEWHEIRARRRQKV